MIGSEEKTVIRGTIASRAENTTALGLANGSRTSCLELMRSSS